MSPEISTLVSEYAGHLDEVAPPVTVEELETTEGLVSLQPISGPVASKTRRGWLVAGAAAVIVLLAGGIVVLAQRPSGNQAPVITQPEPVTTTVPQTVPSTLPGSPPTTLPDTSPTTLLAPDVAPGVGLSWQRMELDAGINAVVVFDGGDRFVVPVLIDEFVAEIHTSSDGATWTTRAFPLSDIYSDNIRAVWENTLLVVTGGGGFSTTEDGPVFSVPSTVTVVRSDGEPMSRVFDSDVQSAAIGPAGIVVRASSFLDEDLIVHNVLGADFSDNLSEVELLGGVLHAETNDGRTAEIDLAENGYDLDELGRVEGWYSSDGNEWSPIPDFPPVDGLVGTRDGFVGVNAYDVWHSSDGRAWVNLGSVGFIPIWSSPFGMASRWKDGAIITDGSEFVYVSASGLEPLPAPPDATPYTNSAPWPLVATGDLGITFVSVQDGQYLSSSDGVSWETTNLPADMTDSFGWYTSSAAATDTAVLLLLWDDQGTGGEQDRVWWLGTRP
ncbi:MAG: hypothetical protein HKN03_12420 [Acidimicrobiales bacterium]|nr:hypothetical protein [Acidimicrobiales bacterium]